MQAATLGGAQYAPDEGYGAASGSTLLNGFSAMRSIADLLRAYIPESRAG